MIPDLDIYRSANFLVKHHGEDASLEAAMRPTIPGLKGLPANRFAG